MRGFGRLPSASMVVACIALLVALGGVGVAATRLPANSVGPVQLRANAVSSAKVKNGSLRAIDFAPGQLKTGGSGANGATGAQGPPGPKGDRGPKGDPGPTGPSNAYFDTNAGPVTLNFGPLQRVATVRAAEPGKYVLWAKANFHADASHTNATSSTCVLGRADTDQFDNAWVLVAPNATGSVALMSAQSFDVATSVNLYCNVSGLSTVGDIKLAAIKVGALTTSTG
ncbi:MAG TPA: collagen-like protein [Solirubrobacteraceae bacterium]|nr:collagen-like protein [Solirubrobacteraceae bacterium]